MQSLVLVRPLHALPSAHAGATYFARHETARVTTILIWLPGPGSRSEYCQLLPVPAEQDMEELIGSAGNVFRRHSSLCKNCLQSFREHWNREPKFPACPASPSPCGKCAKKFRVMEWVLCRGKKCKQKIASPSGVWLCQHCQGCKLRPLSFLAMVRIYPSVLTTARVLCRA